MLNNIRTAVIACFAYSNSLVAMMWIIATEFDLSTNWRGAMCVSGWFFGLVFSVLYITRRLACPVCGHSSGIRECDCRRCNCAYTEWS